MEWTREQTSALIKEFEKHPVLYKVTHEDHLKLSKRAEALQKIANELQICKNGVTQNEVKRKIRGLQRQLSQEKKRIAYSERNRTHTSQQYKPSLWCFHDLHFLLNANEDVRGTSNMEPDNELSFKEVTPEDYNSNFETTDSHKSQSSPNKTKSSVATTVVQQFHITTTNAMNAMSNFINVTPEPKTKQQLFCELLSLELQEIKLYNTYDSVTSSIFDLVRKAKAEERKTMQHGNMLASLPMAATVPIIDRNILPNVKEEFLPEEPEGTL